MPKTEKNLQEAFAGESQANRKYLSFAKKAEMEGYQQVAKLFRAVAEAETVHAHNHLRELDGVNTTRENLNETIKGKSYEFLKIYPQMVEDAKAESKKSAEISFHYANEVEKVNARLYKKALENLGNNPEVDYYLCRVCGYIAEGEAPDACPVCKAKKQLFKKVA